MARTQQGVSAVTVWMIVFVFFWLVSTVWLVVLYTNQEELRATNANLQKNIRQLATQQERNSIELLKSVSDSGPTAVGLLEEARAETARLASGDAKDSVAAVKTKRDSLLRAIKADKLIEDAGSYTDVSLAEGFSRLYELFKKERSLRRAAEERTGELDAEVGRLVQLTTGLKTEFEQMAKELQDRMNTVEQERAAYRSDRDGTVAAMASEFESRKAQTDADLTAERQKRSQAEKQVAEIKRRMDAILEKFDDVQIGPEELATARLPDGRILRAVPGDDIVYIDRGEGDRLVLGMRFGVYSAKTGIPAHGKAKAEIEVLSILPQSAECKVLRVAPHEVILDGDLIASPVYDPKRPPSFVVLGEFDLNYDGVRNPEERATIEALIREWGGLVADEVNAMTDFVVVGASPPRPKTVTNPTAEQTARATAMKRALDEYSNQLATADMLGVQTMTQDVFLSFLGRRVASAPRR